MNAGAPPTFIIIGAVKCGTTSLHAYLDFHPEISMSKVKETNHFLADCPTFPGKVVGGWHEYIATMDAGAPVRGESSPAYSMYPRFEGVPGRIYEAIPEVKVIYLVRDPVERIVSQYLMRVASSQPHLRVADPGLGFERVVGDLEDRRNPYACPGFYMTQIRQYLDHFRPENILVVDSSDLEADRRETLRTIFRFLAVDELFWDQRIMASRLNVGASKRRVRDEYAAFIGRPPLSWIRDLVPDKYRQTLTQPFRNHMTQPIERPVPEAEFLSRVQDAFGEEIAELRKFTGMSFSSWNI